MNNKFISLIIVVFFCFFTGCSGNGSDSDSNSGNISLSLTDATSDKYSAVYVTIDEIQVHKKDGDPWQTIATPKETINLLKLVNGVRKELGITELDSGEYTMMRLISGENHDGGINILSHKHPYPNYIITSESEELIPLKIPSGDKSGVKTACEFNINQNLTTEIILDFDAEKSIVSAGSSGNWILKPVIKILETSENSIIAGTVADNNTNAVQAIITAQQADPGAIDDKNKIIVATSTLTDLTDSEGSYKLFLKAGTYNIVGYANNYLPKCFTIETESGKEYLDNNFTLDPLVDTGVLNLNALIDTEDEDQYVTVSIRQITECNSIENEIEITSVNILNGTNVEITLPTGVYNVAAFCNNKETITHLDIIIEKNNPYSLSIEI